MPRYFFDYRDEEGLTPDDVGEELPGDDAARKMAFLALGDAVRDITMRGNAGRIAIDVRDSAGRPTLSLAATIEVMANDYKPEGSFRPERSEAELHCTDSKTSSRMN